MSKKKATSNQPHPANTKTNGHITKDHSTKKKEDLAPTLSPKLMFVAGGVLGMAVTLGIVMIFVWKNNVSTPLNNIPASPVNRFEIDLEV